ncbi:MAG: LacI family DNA-binding transcriptional regulator [Myxococcota bacterium]
MTRKRATIAEVARAANVAVSTVSRVINGGYASEAVRQRVNEAVRALQYVPSSTARNLKKGRTGIIGVVVESSQGAWFNQLLAGIEEHLFGKELSVAVCSLKRRSESNAGTVRSWLLEERRVDGLVFARATASEWPLIKLAKQRGIPIAFVAPDETFELGSTFRTLNRAAGRAVAGHLLELGHEKIAFGGGPPTSIDTQDRLSGLKEQLGKQGLEPGTISFGSDYTPKSGVQMAQAWLAAGKPTTAVVLGNDSMALGFMRRVQSEGIQIPHEVSVVGFDGIPEAELWFPSLTTAEQRTFQMGVAASESLLARLDGKLSDECVTHEYTTILRVRESTGPVP